MYMHTFSCIPNLYIESVYGFWSSSQKIWKKNISIHTYQTFVCANTESYLNNLIVYSVQPNLNSLDRSVSEVSVEVFICGSVCFSTYCMSLIFFICNEFLLLLAIKKDMKFFAQYVETYYILRYSQTMVLYLHIDRKLNKCFIILLINK